MRFSILSARRVLAVALAAAVAMSFAAPTRAADEDYWGLEPGKVELKSVGPMAFGPEGVLFVSDTTAATVYAIGTDDTKGEPAKVSLNIADLNAKLAEALQAKPDQIRVADMVANPDSGNVYFGLTAGSDNKPALVRLTAAGKLEPLALANVKHSKITFTDAPESKPGGRGNPRDSSITDLAYLDGRLIVSGLTSAKSPAAVREMDFPFTDKSFAVNFEYYHGAHGRTEDYAPARTFIPFIIDGKPELLAGFTCTPLVRFPLDAVRKGEKITGTTVAELGNRNQPLDMIAYKKAGKGYLLMSNSARGVMKISTEGIEKQEAINAPVKGGGTAGQEFETIKDWQGVTQLDKLNDTHAIVLIKTGEAAFDLKTMELP
ncbi:MAG: hypothetical protein WD875_19600 [Pirellulales bacterium]